MGSNSKTSHQSYVVAPTAGAAASHEAAEPEASAHEPSMADDQDGHSQAQQLVFSVECLAHGGVDPEDLFGPPVITVSDDLIEQYHQFASAVAEALAHINTIQDPDLAADLRLQVKAHCQSYLSSLTWDTLQNIAAAQGFLYPQLVGLNDDMSHALAHWLNPIYPADAESKKKIQAAAQLRYDALCAGLPINGMNLQQWQAQYPSLGAAVPPSPSASATWQASPADFINAQTALGTALADLHQEKAKLHAADWPAAVAAVVHAENKLATANCPELGPAAAAAIAAARHQVTQALTHVNRAALEHAVATALACETITPEQVKVLAPAELLPLLRASTPDDERTELMALANERTAMVTNYMHASAAVGAYFGQHAQPLPTLGNPASADAAMSFLDNAGQMVGLAGKIHKWGSSPYDPQTTNSINPNTTPVSVEHLIKLWAPSQPLSDLREFAAQQGLGEAATIATKSQIASYLGNTIAAHSSDPVKSAIAQQQIALLQSNLDIKLAHKHSPPLAPPAPTPPSAAHQGVDQKTPTSATGAPPVVAAPNMLAKSSFATAHAHLVAALQHAAASHKAIPARESPTTVASWSFGPGQPAALGGTAPKSLHTAPDGSTWMFKQTKSAFAHAEAATSHVLARAGLPSIPVYATTINGKHGSIQPLLTGTTPLEPSPKAWSQADVDAIVRLHVASWAVGDHDGHHDNVLRTTDGGLVPIDGGQAFKFFGSDQLSMSYKPSTTPVYHRAYKAHLNGDLAPGVKVNPAAAHPVLKQLEAIPDSEWRSMLHHVAHAGARHSSASWVPAMRARAAKAHNVPEHHVTADQIATTFLDNAVQRKQSLRASFASFFSTELKSASAVALQHMGGS